MISSAPQARIINQASFGARGGIVSATSHPPTGVLPLRNVTSEPVLRVRRCRACNVVFYVCSSCDRGQRYCRQECRASARRQQLRAANRRYQCSPDGRQAHQRRQRQYRLRFLGTRVTDQGSRSITTPPLPGPPKPSQCVVCACSSRWIDPFPAISRSEGPKGWRRQVGGRSKNYVFR